jgi:hypothetical protein
MAGRTDFNPGRFNELVLVFADRSKDDPRISRVKLNKLLYRADFEAFRLLGRSITGATYVRGEFGPMAAELPGAEKELGRRGLLAWRREAAGTNKQKIPIAVEGADETQFSEQELEIITRTLAELAEHGGKGASDWSHEESAGWRLKPDGAEITYESGLIDNRPLDPDRLEALREYVAMLRG